MNPGKTSVLFLCVENSCRSQMAEGLLNHLAGDRFEAASAGTHPSSLNSMAVQVMREIGIDISAQRSKSVDEMLGRQFNYVITVCDAARTFCPSFPASIASHHWNLEDPAASGDTPEEQRKAFLDVRQKLQRLITNFIRDVRPS
jgi:arsenate reductase